MARARQRFIHPEIWSDTDFGHLQPTEQVLFIGLFSNADDEGRILADPAYLRSTIWPYKNRLTTNRVRACVAKVVKAMPSLTHYRVDGIEYIAFRKWAEYQKPRYPSPSKHPAPPEIAAKLPQDFSNAAEDVPHDSRKPSVTDWVGLREESVVEEGQKPRTHARNPDPDPDFPERDPAPEPPYPAGEQRPDFTDDTDFPETPPSSFVPPTDLLRSI